MAPSLAWRRARRRPSECPQEGRTQRSQPPRASKAAPRVERTVAPPRRSQGQPCLGVKAVVLWRPSTGERRDEALAARGHLGNPARHCGMPCAPCGGPALH
eukprot:2776959-Alexandrium_andersonii.AAC.1